MALTNKRIMIMADTVVGDEKIATHSATITINGTEKKLTLTTNYLDKDKYNSNKSVVDADQSTFETSAETLFTGTAIYA